jgi:hypothetical protein
MIGHNLYVYLGYKNNRVPSTKCLHLLQTNAHKPWFLGILSVVKGLHIQINRSSSFEIERLQHCHPWLVENSIWRSPLHLILSQSVSVSTGMKLTDFPLITLHILRNYKPIHSSPCTVKYIWEYIPYIRVPQELWRTCTSQKLVRLLYEAHHITEQMTKTRIIISTHNTLASCLFAWRHTAKSCFCITYFSEIW